MKKTALFFVLFFIIFQLAAQKTTLYYDTSYGMRHKNFTTEVVYLDSYFKNHPNLIVKLIKFSNVIILEESFTISNGDWSALKKELKNTIYDGSASFKYLMDTNVDETLLFTDGNETIDDLPQGFLKPVHIISTVPKPNIEGLETLAQSSRGTYTNLYKQTKKIKLGTSIIKGVVKDLIGPLSEVIVQSRENNHKTITGKNGAYEIEAQKGGILEFSFIGKNTVITRVPKSGIKNITLTDGNEILDEIVITADIEDHKTEEVNTGNTKIDKRKIGYAVESISSKDISDQDIRVEDAVAGQFSNIDIKSDQDITQFLSRGRNMTMLLNQTGLVVVDGVPLNSSPRALTGLSGDKSIVSGSALLNPDNIASITVLKGLAATNKWGTLGRNGVILITTKSANGNKGISKKKIKLGTTPTYTGDNLSVKNLGNAPYINALKSAKDIDEAYIIYLRQRKIYGNDINFFMDVATYFKDWNNPILLNRIVSNIAEFANNDPNVLRAQAYKYEEFGMKKEALVVYERIFKLYPNETQTYRNLALAYQNANKYKKALAIYNKIDKNKFTLITSFSGVKKSINNEFKNLVALHKDQLNTTAVNSFYLNNIEYNTRVVFEWNAYDAEFDLQIVNPQKRYFTWSHTQKGESARFDKERKQGYGLEEFFITKEDKGIWLFNITYFGKRRGDNSSPSYLKITTYRNFGKRNQTQQIKVVSLKELNKKESVISLKI